MFLPFARNKWAKRVEVVVFPCVPAMAKQFCSAAISPKRRARFIKLKPFSVK